MSDSASSLTVWPETENLCLRLLLCVSMPLTHWPISQKTDPWGGQMHMSFHILLAVISKYFPAVEAFATSKGRTLQNLALLKSFKSALQSAWGSQDSHVGQLLPLNKYGHDSPLLNFLQFLGSGVGIFPERDVFWNIAIFSSSTSKIYSASQPSLARDYWMIL